MNYEQKYKDALEWARAIYPNMPEEDKEDMDAVFPELKESEDERIRKGLINIINLSYDCGIAITKENYKKYIAWLEKQESVGEIVERCKTSWYNEGKIQGQIEGLSDDEKYLQGWHDALEKQGEQKSELPKWKYKKDNTPLLRDSIILNKYGGVAKSPSGAIISDAWVLDYDELAKLPKEEIEKQDVVNSNSITNANKIKPKFKVGDWIVQKNNWIVQKNIGVYKVIEICNLWYEVIDSEDNHYKISYDKECMCHLWSIEDAKDGDCLTVNGRPFIYCCNDEYQGNYCCIDSYGVFRTNLDFGFNGKTILPATKEQHDLLFQMMKKYGYDFDGVGLVRE